MLRIGFFLAALMIAGTLSSATTPPALASEYIVEGKAVITAVSTEGTTGSFTLESATIKVECKKGTAPGKLEEKGVSTEEIGLKECSVLAPSHCAIKEPIELKLKGALIGEPAEAEFKAKEGTIIGHVSFLSSGGTCLVAGSLNLKGTQICTLPKGEEPLAEHETVCSTTGSSLTLGEEAAVIKTTLKTKLPTKGLFGIFTDPSAGLTPAGGVSFVGGKAGDKAEITVTNTGKITAYLNKERIEEGGRKPEETNFEIVAGGGAQPCKFTTPRQEEFETLEKKGDWCTVGVKFLSGKAGENGKYVLNYSCFWGYTLCGLEATLSIKS